MKVKSTRRISAFVLGVTTVVLLSGCPSSGPGGGNGGGSGVTGEDTNDLLAGQVSSVAGEPIAGATVSLDNGRSTSTDDNGFYSFSGLTAELRVVVSIRADGFASTSKAFIE